MAVVGLEILEPANGLVLAGNGDTHFRAVLQAAAPSPLFFKWYSSLEAPSPPGSPLPGGITLDFRATLGVGSHVITLSAKDQAGDDEPSLKKIKHGGMAGGVPSPSNPRPCVITVLLAEIIAAPGLLTLSKSSSQLVAIAPRQWGRPSNLGPPLPPPPITYVPNPDYQAVNRVVYIWRFTPLGAPAGRQSADLVPAFTQLSFDGSFAAALNRPVVIYRGALPAQLGTGNYRMTLRLQDARNAGSAHEVSQNVTLTA